ncbi:MAG: aspartate aminotransferase family protein [Alphaproteobacteria bacterium]|nr:aspartate aminotransferase family protein [Alphaproteobacteria bacterium]
MTTAPHLDTATFRALGHALVDRVADYLDGVGDLPVAPSVRPGDLTAALPAQAPETGEPWEAILADVDRLIVPGLLHWQSPRFFGYFPANASGPAILGELLSAGLGVQGMLWATSPACTELETVVLDWLGRALGLPARFLSTGEGGGVIQGTASEAVLVAILAARDRALRSGARLDQLVVFASTEAHSSVTKGARIAGLGHGVRLVGVDGALAMDADALRAAVEAERAAGRVPCFVCATVGTTSSTAIDPVAAIGAVAQAAGMWLHVDGAFAGSAAICPEQRHLLDGVERADSVCVNPHKWLLTNFDCSALWLADRRPVVDALAITPEYLRHATSERGAVIDYRDWQVPLGRRFRALKLWFVLRHYGVEGLRAHVRDGLAQAVWVEAAVRADPRFELAAPRTSALVCFRLVDDDPERGDARNQALLAALNASGALYLSHTRLPARDAAGALTGPPRHTLRLALGGARTSLADVQAAWSVIAANAG